MTGPAVKTARKSGHSVSNNNDKRYSGYETLNIAPSDVFTAAEFPIRQAAVAVSISGLEMLQNA